MADSPNRSSKLAWLIALMVVMLGALVALNMYLLLSDDSDDDNSEPAKQTQAPQPVTYVKIAPFTVNLQGDLCGQRLLYVGLSLQVADADTESHLLEHMPQLRSRLLMLLSGQSSQSVATQQGKEQLKAAILNLFEQSGEDDSQPELNVNDVLFTEFIVQ